MSEINKVLKEFPEYWAEESLIKHKVINDLREYKIKLIEQLLNNDTISKSYSIKTNKGLVIKIEDLISMLRYKKYWEDSYTKYSTQIGLSSNGKYLSYNSDIVLDFPYKDCVLEGGMSSEDYGKKEIYYHEIIAREEIDIMLSPKVLTNVKKFTPSESYTPNNFDGTDNLLLKGNNLIALHSLKERYTKKVKLIYIDPPYNTGGDSFKYNDRFNHATWLTFMKNRLEVAKDLLANDGSIAISIDNNEIAYLLILMDEIFGRENRKNLITVKRGSVTGAKVINPGVVNVSEFVVIYSKDASLWQPNRVYASRSRDERYNQYILNYEKGHDKWEFTTVLEMFAHENGIKKSQLKKHFENLYEIKLEEFVYKNSDRIARFAALDESSRGKQAIEIKKQSLENPTIVYYLARENEKPLYIYKGNIILFVRDRMSNIDGKDTFSQPISDIWDDVLPNDLHNEGGVELRKGKKPEKLISRIIELCTNEKDLVLDFFAGSGTTASVALKKKRRFIAIEQLDYIEKLTTTRLINTIKGDNSGISKTFNWKGGGDFVYGELFPLNNSYVSLIQRIRTDEDLNRVIQAIKHSAFLNYKVELDRLTIEDSGFNLLSLEEKKKILIKSLDANQLYLSYSEIEDKQYEISEAVKLFNQSFYKGNLSEGEKL